MMRTGSTDEDYSKRGLPPYYLGKVLDIKIVPSELLPSAEEEISASTELLKKRFKGFLKSCF